MNVDVIGTKILAILTLISLHWGLLMAVGGVWILLATKLGAKWAKPSRPWYAVLAHFLLVDLPSAAKALNGHKVSILGLKFDINWAVPFVSWSTLAPAAPPADKAG